MRLTVSQNSRWVRPGRPGVRSSGPQIWWWLLFVFLVSLLVFLLTSSPRVILMGRRGKWCRVILTARWRCLMVVNHLTRLR